MRLAPALLAALLAGAFLAPAAANATHSPDGKLVYATGTDIFVCPFPRDGALCLGVDFGAQNLHPTLSPDAERVAYGHNGGIRATDLANLERTDLTATGRDAWPAWSPNGQWIYFHRFEQDPPDPPAPPNVDVYRVPSDGSAPAEPFQDSDTLIQGLPAVLDNGNVAAYTTDLDGSGGRVEIYTPQGAHVQTTGPVPEGTVNALVPGSLTMTVNDPESGRSEVFRWNEATNGWEPYDGATPEGGCSLPRPLGGGHLLCAVEAPATPTGIFVCSHCDEEIAGDTKGVDVHEGTPDEDPPPTAPPDDDPPTTPPDEEPAPTYDLVLTPFPSIISVPLVRGRGSQTGRAFIRRQFERDAGFGEGNAAPSALLVNDQASQRESVLSTLLFGTNAPLLFETRVHAPGHPEADPSGMRMFPLITLGTQECRVFDFHESEFRDIRGNCRVDPMVPGEIKAAVAGWMWDHRREPLTESHHRTTHRFRWHVFCRPPQETDCSNNHRVGRFQLSFEARSKPTRIGSAVFGGRVIAPATEAKPDSRRALTGASPAAGGGNAASPQRRARRTVKRADRPARVQIALVRLTRRQRGFRGLPALRPPNPAQAAGAPRGRCTWLANRKRKFKKNRAGANNVCDKPIWVRAKLAKPRKRARAQRWRLRLKKPLRPGRYVLYSRATTRWGMPEVTFTKKRGNRVQFRVRKRR